jgi:DNA-binding beta-propeller fold protein YncE
VVLAGCGPKKVSTEPGKGKKSTDYIFYPQLPNEPKYQYLTTFSTSKDIEKKKSKFFKFVAGKEVEKILKIKKAYGVDIYKGIIYTCDVSSGVVATLDLEKKEFGYLGHSGSGKLIKPVNIDIDRENDLIYVADMGRKQVVCYNLQGRPLKFYGKKGDFHPSDVKVHKNKLFVCDVRGHRIHVLDVRSGKTLYKIGKPGSNKGELFHPTNIAIAFNRIYVAETNNFRFQVFDLKGKFISTYGRVGDRPGEFSRPKGIAVDRDKRIYVVDSAFENVQVFDKKYKLLLFMLRPGAQKHNINLPADITLDYDNIRYFKKYLAPKFKPEYLVFVTSNFGNNKVNVYAFGSYGK